MLGNVLVYFACGCLIFHAIHVKNIFKSLLFILFLFFLFKSYLEMYIAYSWFCAMDLHLALLKNQTEVNLNENISHNLCNVCLAHIISGYFVKIFSMYIDLFLDF